jgi:hypothetical protein
VIATVTFQSISAVANVYAGGLRGGIYGASAYSSAVPSGGQSGSLIQMEVQGVEQFNAEMKQIGRQLEDMVDLAIRKAIIDLWADLVDNNPVETGRSRAGWIVSGSSPSDYVPPEGQNSYDVTQDQATPPSHAAIYYVTNNVEYISVLNDGHSSQAPAGWIDLAVANFEDHLKQALHALPNSDWLRS